MLSPRSQRYSVHCEFYILLINSSHRLPMAEIRDKPLHCNRLRLYSRNKLSAIVCDLRSAIRASFAIKQLHMPKPGLRHSQLDGGALFFSSHTVQCLIQLTRRLDGLNMPQCYTILVVEEFRLNKYLQYRYIYQSLRRMRGHQPHNERRKSLNRMSWGREHLLL